MCCVLNKQTVSVSECGNVGRGQTTLSNRHFQFDHNISGRSLLRNANKVSASVAELISYYAYIIMVSR